MKTREEIQESVASKLAASGFRALKRGAGEQMTQLPFTLGVNVAGLVGDQIRQGLNLYGGRARMGAPFTAAGTKSRRLQGKQNVDRAIVDPLIGTQDKPGAVQLGIAKGMDKFDELRLDSVTSKIKELKAMEAEPSKRSERENAELTAKRKKLEKKQSKFQGKLGIGESYSYGSDNPGKTRGQRFLKRYGQARKLNPEFSDVPLTDKDRQDLQKRRDQEYEGKVRRQAAQGETESAAASSKEVADALSALKKSGESIRLKVKGALKNKLNPYNLEP